MTNSLKHVVLTLLMVGSVISLVGCGQHAEDSAPPTKPAVDAKAPETQNTASEAPSASNPQGPETPTQSTPASNPPPPEPGSSK